MRPRFLVSDLHPSSNTATLTAGEAHHLARVLRLGPGDEVSVFDGRGREFAAIVDGIAGSTVRVRLGARIEAAPERRVRITLAQAVLKGSSMDEAIRDATMMGVAAIQPLVTAHTVARRAGEAHGADRWRRIAVASVKQCRRAWIPEVFDPEPFNPSRARGAGDLALLLVEPSLRDVTVARFRSFVSEAPPASVTLAVGPEGGWSVEETRAAIDVGYVPITLGPLTLRAESVPIAALAALSVLWD